MPVGVSVPVVPSVVFPVPGPKSVVFPEVLPLPSFGNLVTPYGLVLQPRAPTLNTRANTNGSISLLTFILSFERAISPNWVVIVSYFPRFGKHLLPVWWARQAATIHLRHRRSDAHKLKSVSSAPTKGLRLLRVPLPFRLPPAPAGPRLGQWKQRSPEVRGPPARPVNASAHRNTTRARIATTGA